MPSATFACVTTLCGSEGPAVDVAIQNEPGNATPALVAGVSWANAGADSRTTRASARETVVRTDVPFTTRRLMSTGDRRTAAPRTRRRASAGGRPPTKTFSGR